MLTTDHEDQDSPDETACLLRSPANAKRLLEALESYRKGEAGVSVEDAVRHLGLDGDRRQP